MPSPVAHSLIGIAIASAWLLPRATFRELPRHLWNHRIALAVGVVLANLPDIDFIPGLLTGDLNRFHHQHTHTLGFVLFATFLVDWAWRRRADAPRTIGLLALALLGSHLVADLFIQDSKPPYGIMALWPFSPEYYISPIAIFPRIEKASLVDAWQWSNLQAGAAEFAITAPLVLLAFAWICIKPAARATFVPPAASTETT